MSMAIGVDVGGGSAKIGLVEANGAIRYRTHVITPATTDPVEALETYVKGIQEAVDQLPASTAKLAGIGIGMPGQINPGALSTTSSNVPVLDDYPIVSYLDDRFGLPVRLDNDATVAALAEYRFGAGIDSQRMLLVTVGTGIGLGFVAEGRAQRPTRGCMGDPGHIIVDPEGRWRCNLGCSGCLETVATSLALERDAMAAANWCEQSILHDVSQEQGELPARLVIETAQAGDAVAISLIEQMGHWLGLAAASYCHIYAPASILVGGGVSAAGELLLEPLRKTLAETGMRSYVEGVTIRRAQLGNDAGMIGAASLLFDDVYQS